MGPHRPVNKHVFKSSKECVDNYVNDFILFSDGMESHMNLCQMLLKLGAAGFTLHGSKCFC